MVEYLQPLRVVCHNLNAYMQVRCPVRIIQGAEDTVVPPFVASEVVAWLESKNVNLTLIKVWTPCQTL